MAADPFAIVDAVREQIKLRMLIDGVSGSGKTATALLFATALARRYKGKIGLIATEHNRDLAYVGTKFAPDGYQRIVLAGTKSVANYRAALNRFKTAGGFSVVIIDSLSHAWMGEGGVLEEVDNLEEKNHFAKWQTGSKIHNRLLSSIVDAPYHVIATVRSKTEHSLVPDEERPGKTRVARIGMKPQQRDEIEYEFGIYVRMDDLHNMTVLKTDCDFLDRVVVPKPDMTFMEKVMDWMDTGKAPEAYADATKLASVDMIAEYLQILSGPPHNYKTEVIREGFQKQYGMWLEDAPETLLRQRIDTLKEDLAKKLRNKPA